MRSNKLLYICACAAFVVSGLACEDTDSNNADQASIDSTRRHGEDIYDLGGTYHDYRTCQEQEDEPRMSDEPESPERSAETVTMIPYASVDLPDGNPVPLQSDLYFFNFNLVEFSIVRPFQLEVETAPAEPVVLIKSMKLRAVNIDEDTKAETISDVFATMTDVPVKEDGTFQAKFPTAFLPKDFSPSGSEVELALTLNGVIQTENSFCGGVVGRLINLESEIEASTFAAVPWDMRGDETPIKCGQVEIGEACPRVGADMCPDFEDGDNAFDSCGLKRTVRVRLPTTYDPSKRYKTVILFHGFDVDPDDIEEDTGMQRLVDAFDFVLIMPYSQPFGVEWDQLSWRDNADVALVDDLMTCAKAKLSADPERLYLAGDSGGGLFATYLTLLRGDVIAATAINSGGLFIDLPPKKTRAVPMIWGWGGECDLSRGQSFNTFALNGIPKLGRNGNFIVKCNHDTGHEWKPRFSPWMVEFLFAHTLSDTTSPWAAGLSDSLPSYCEIHENPQ
ncbi:MAG: PHB depolymerase family esterase [Myxococcota bacterium]|nr:PHB depolymerase family esterase [Myxococcota bacterium]